MQKKRNAKMTAYAKTMDHEIADAEFSPVETNPAAKDASTALEDLSVEELRVMVRATLGKSHAISVMRKEGLIQALVTGKLPTNEAAATKSIVQLPTQQADLANLLAQAVAMHLPKAGVDEETVTKIVNKNVQHLVERVVNTELKIGKMDEKVTKGLNVLVDGMSDVTKSLSAALDTRLNNAVEALNRRADQDQEARTAALRADFENMALRAMDAKADSMGDAITVKLQKKLVKEIVIKRPDGVKVPVGAQHEQFPELLQVLACGLNVFLVGPAAAGKTRAAEECAKALDLAFYPQSFNAQTPSSQIFGYMDAQGRYVSTVFRKAFEEGGLWLADEIDRGNGNVLTALNAALENGYCSFPDGVVKRHEKFLCVASANTWGRGADRTYVGANALDEATLDRFVQMEWNYDENLERLLAGNPSWVDRVQAIRQAVFDERVRLLVSPRASFRGAKLLAAGLKWARVEELTLWKGVDKATKEKVLARAPKLVTRIQIEGVE